MYKSITVVGNVGKDPEIRHLANGATAANFSVAVNEQWTNGEGLTEKRVTWMNVVAYQQGERGLVTALIQPYLRQGQLVFIQADPVLRQYVDRDGNQRIAFEIKLGPQSTIKMLGGKPAEKREGDEANGAAREPVSEAEKEAAANAAAERRRKQAAIDEDIPF
jgi:single-strand DNA-binding protein